MNELEKRISKLEKKLDLIIKAQEQFYPNFDKYMKALIKSYNELNKTVKNTVNIAGMFGTVFEENKDTITQISEKLAEDLKKSQKTNTVET